MPNNPIQVVINSSSFVGDAVAAGGGANKDFYANRDQQFLAHRNSISTQLVTARAQIASSGRGTVYARVALRPDAWAKSHRPTQAIFKEASSPVVGANDLGELLIELSESSVNAALDVVNRAEPETRMVPGPNQRLVPKPSRARSELGAIAKIQMYGPSDRRSFSALDSSRWLADPRTGRYLLVQLFDGPGKKHRYRSADTSDRATRNMAFLSARLHAVDPSLGLTEISDWWTEQGFRALPLANSDPLFHEAVFAVLDTDPLVRRLLLPPIAVATNPGAQASEGAPDRQFEAPKVNRTYPVVGVIDTGIADVAQLHGWVVGASTILDPGLQDLHHGTFIGGLLADNGTLNGQEVSNEEPCQIFDLGLHATDDSQAIDTYPNGFIDFLQQLEFEMEPAVQAGVRVFNMSLAIEELVRDDSYSPFAARIDDLADKYDVIFVLPTGNLNEPQFRDPWPAATEEVLPALANYRHLGQDRLYQPAESLRAVTVGALNPESAGGAPSPTVYSRRGPGTGLGHKPEFAHIGGFGAEQTGLRSLSTSGSVVDDCGTSFAAPQVAKILANVEHRIEGPVRRETIVALAVHGATVPERLSHNSLAGVARDFVGFGVPARSENLLSTGDDAITLVFESRLMRRKEMDFMFQWPQSLVGTGGKCRGTAELTLVYRPPIDLLFGSEAVRVNMEAYLRQEKIDTRTGELKYEGFFKSAGVPVLERERVAHGQKWGAVKHWERTSRDGVGRSSQWKLVVEPLARSGIEVPDAGIPFTAILTIRDPEGSAPVFNQMRRSLQAGSAQISDIRTAQRVRPRQ